MVPHQDERRFMGNKNTTKGYALKEIPNFVVQIAKLSYICRPF